MAERALAAQEKVEEREAAHALASVTSAVADMEDEDENADEPIWQLTDGVDVSQEGRTKWRRRAILSLLYWSSLGGKEFSSLIHSTPSSSSPPPPRHQ